MPAASPLIFVLGMHRSGTSALARALNLLGAGLPDELLGPNTFNPKGYWEPKPVIRVNEAWLAEAGSAWDAPAPLEIDGSIEAAAEVLRNHYANGPLGVVKDPRCTLFAEHWARAAEAAGFAPSFVVIRREPEAVADSLKRRNAMTAAEAGLLWSWYGVRALQALTVRGGALVTYRALASDWRRTTAVIAEATGVDWPVSSDVAAASLEAFLDPPGDAPTVVFPDGVADLVEATQAAYRAFEAREDVGDLARLEAAILSRASISGSAVARVRAEERARRALLKTQAQEAGGYAEALQDERDAARAAHAEAERRADEAAAYAAELEAERDAARSAQEAA